MRIETLVYDEARDLYKPVRRRIQLIRWLVLLLFAGAVGRLGFLQILHGDDWKKMAREEHSIRVQTVTKRGTVYDRHMSKLAMSAETLSLFADPAELGQQLGERTAEVAAQLAPVLGLPAADIGEKLGQRRNFVWLKRDLAPETVEAVRALKLPGFGFKREYKRVYPMGNLAAHVIGGVGLDADGLLDNKGLDGAEWAYDDVLKGELIRETIVRNPSGTEYEKEGDERRGGRYLVLTIDEIIQHIVEQELEEAYREWQPEFACVVVMDPLTGEILGVSSRPTFDNVAIRSSAPGDRRNRPFLDLFEPGSIFKIFTFAAALEAKAVSLDDTINCVGEITIMDRFRIRCHGTSHGLQTVPEVFANSCNVGTVQIAQRLGQRLFGAALEKYRFNAGIDLLPKVNEPRGILRPERTWSGLSLPSLAIGQEVAVTALHLIRAGSAVLNNGIMMKPLLVREVETAKGNREVTSPAAESRVMTAETAAKMRVLMRRVVLTGTGRSADIPGYNVMGKTGSAQIANPRGGYLEGRWTASFLGFVEEPAFKVAIIVTVKDPRRPGINLKDITGGKIAAPVFRKIAERILMYKQILPTNMRVNTVIRISDRRSDTRVPDLVGKNFSEVERDYSGEVELVTRGSGPLVVKQFPPPLRLMNRKDSLVLFLGGDDDLEANSAPRNEPFMRHFIGKSARESLEMLQGFRQPLYFEGSGFVVEQDPGAGTPLSDDTLIKLKFATGKR